MADETAVLIEYDDLTELGAGTSKNESFQTEARRDFAIFVEAQVDSGGDAADTIDFTVFETSDPNAAESTWRQVATANQITGTTSGNDLKQKILLSDLNYNSYLVLKATASGSLTANADKVKNIKAYVGYNNRV